MDQVRRRFTEVLVARAEAMVGVVVLRGAACGTKGTTFDLDVSLIRPAGGDVPFYLSVHRVDAATTCQRAQHDPPVVGTCSSSSDVIETCGSWECLERVSAVADGSTETPFGTVQMWRLSNAEGVVLP
jgi:uncharacterized membrane protein (DUF2068 family)